MPVKLFKCALPITKGLCFSAHLLRSWFLPSMLQDLLQYACPAGLLLSRCWSSPSPLQRHSLEVLHEISPCHGHSASVLTCTCGVCSFFFSRQKQHQKVAERVPMFRSAQGRTTPTLREQVAQQPPRAWLLQLGSRQVPQLRLHSS